MPTELLDLSLPAVSADHVGPLTCQEVQDAILLLLVNASNSWPDHQSIETRFHR